MNKEDILFNQIRQREKEQEKSISHWRDLLPLLNTRKRSVIASDVCEKIEFLYNSLNNSGLFDEKITYYDLAWYLLDDDVRTYSKRFSQHLRTLEFNANFVLDNGEYDLKKKEKLSLEDKEKNQNICDKIEFLINHLNFLKDSYKTLKLLDKKQVKRGYDGDKPDFEDGFPRLGRGNLCCAYVGVIDLPKGLNIGDIINLYNPRNKRNKNYIISDKYSDDETIYFVSDGNISIYIINYEEINNAWDCLCSVNKELFRGWWNKKLIYKDGRI